MNAENKAHDELELLFREVRELLLLNVNLDEKNDVRQHGMDERERDVIFDPLFFSITR